MLLLLCSSSLLAQSVTTTCSSLEVTGLPVPFQGILSKVDQYGEHLGRCFADFGECCFSVVSPGNATHEIVLFRRLSNGNRQFVERKFASSASFDNLSIGDYFVEVFYAIEWTSPACPNGALLYDVSPQPAYKGRRAARTVNPAYTSEDIRVGPTFASDIVYTPIDPDPGFFTYGWDSDEDPKFDFSQTGPHSMHFIAVFEEVAPFRYSSTSGWVSGRIPNEVNVASFMPGLQDWSNYTLQVAIENSGCRNAIEWPSPSWNAAAVDIQICAAGFGCEEQEITEIVIGPNPAVNQIHVQGLNDYTGIQYAIFDVGGREITRASLSTQEIDIANLVSGAYILQIFEETGAELHQSKLIVRK